MKHTRIRRNCPGFRPALLMVLLFCCGLMPRVLNGQLPPRYATLELFTNTPCPICGNQNPGLFNRLANFEGQYHLISFYPGTPYPSCIFYQANTAENLARKNYYTGILGSPTVIINGTQMTNSSGVTNSVLENVTGTTTWLHVDVIETDDAEREVTINLRDFWGLPPDVVRLFAVIVEREIQYSAPNGETIHRNVFRRFLTSTAGEEVDMTSGEATRNYTYTVEPGWQLAETYVIAWASNPETKEIYNSGTRFDPDFVSSTTGHSGIVPLVLYPNPASDYIRISLPDESDLTDVRIIDVSRRIVLERKITGDQEMKLSLAGFIPGMYWAEVRKGEAVRSRGSFVIHK